jgi:hypothetical protein
VLAIELTLTLKIEDMMKIRENDSRGITEDPIRDTGASGITPVDSLFVITTLI